METFKIIALTPVEHLTSLLRWMEARKIPYNVELNTAKRTFVEGQSHREFVLELVGAKGPITAKGIGDAFQQTGKMRSSAHGAIHTLKKQGFIKSTKNGYVSGAK